MNTDWMRCIRPGHLNSIPNSKQIENLVGELAKKFLYSDAVVILNEDQGQLD